MNAVSEASIRLRRIAEPRPVGDTVKEAINRSARRVSKFLRQSGFGPMTATRAEDLWRQEAPLTQRKWMQFALPMRRRRGLSRRPGMRLRSTMPGSRGSKPFLFRTRSFIAIRWLRISRRIAVLIAPWMESE